MIDSTLTYEKELVKSASLVASGHLVLLRVDSSAHWDMLRSQVLSLILLLYEEKITGVLSWSRFLSLKYAVSALTIWVRFLDDSNKNECTNR